LGERQDESGPFAALIGHWDGRAWSWSSSPNLGSSSNHLDAGAAARRDDVWAVGQHNDATFDQPLVEHWDGGTWSAVSVPAAAGTGAVLDAVTVQGGEVWAPRVYATPPAAAGPCRLH
jgi:hypothetical protein